MSMKTLFKARICNQKGASLMEVVAGLTIVTVITTAVLTCVISGFSLNYKTVDEYSRVSEMYDQIEGNDTDVTDWNDVEESEITFSWTDSLGAVTDATITGNYTYDKDQSKLGEFVYEYRSD